MGEVKDLPQLSLADLWELRTGRRQQVEVDTRAAVASFGSFAHLRLPEPPPRLGPSITRFYPTRDGRWFFLHGSFPNTPARENALGLLRCEENPEAVAAAVLRWDAQGLEDSLADAGCCPAMVRSAEEWAVHPQGRALQNLPVVEIRKIGDSPPEPFQAGDRPLSGIRVLDLTRVLDGLTPSAK